MKTSTILSITHSMPEGRILCSHGTTVPLVFTPEASAVLLRAIGWGREDYPESREEYRKTTAVICDKGEQVVSFREIPESDGDSWNRKTSISDSICGLQGAGEE